MPYLGELVWSRLECNLVKNVVVGMSITVSVVTLTVYIYCENDKVHFLLYNVVVTCFVIHSFIVNSVLPCVLPCPALRAENNPAGWWKPPQHDSCELVGELSSTVDGSHTFGTYMDQN